MTPDVLEDFEARLDPATPDPDRFRVVAYGEISAVIQIVGHDEVVLKRMSGFATDEEVTQYVRVVDDYVAALGGRGITVAPTQVMPITTERNGRVAYLVQPSLPAERLGHALLRTGNEADVHALLEAVYETLAGFYAANAEGSLVLAIDAQLSNWAWDGAALTYFDVGTPFIRRDGVEQMDFAIVTRAMPQPLRWLTERFIAPGVIERYYGLDNAITDILANFVKEGRAELIEGAAEFTNRWTARAGVDLPAFQSRAIHRYYAVDEKIWEFAWLARRLARFVNTRLLGRPYNYLLPGKVKRR
ncbi:MAG: hypothetical protein JRJ84_18935 [Deltaproteobacteria bacterium]|nr:hypothetical protein [Deltaproteobacteria bacterium]